MNVNVWTAEAVSNAILNGNTNLEMVFGNYLKAFIVRLGQYDIRLEDTNSVDQLNQKVLDGIVQLEELRREFLSVIEMFATSNHPALVRFLPDFFQKLFDFYEEMGVNLYAGTTPDVLKNDHYRFFNQFLFVSLTALLVNNQCFESLAAILHAKFKVYNRTYQNIQDVNFIRLRTYNYTLNQYLNTGVQKRVSVTADYIRGFSTPDDFDKAIKADILLYYMSLWYHTRDNIFDTSWIPELSVYNRDVMVLPLLASKDYFEKAKVLFEVKTVDEFKKLLDNTNDSLDRMGVYKIPRLNDGLVYNKVGSMD